MTQTLNWINNISLILQIATVFVWIFRFSRIPRAMQWLGVYLAFNVVIQLVAKQLWLRSMNNLPLLHLNTLVELVLTSVFFREIYINQQWFKRHFTLIVGLMVGVIVLNSIFLEPIYTFNSNAKVLTQAVFIGCVILYLFESFGKIDFSQSRYQGILLICFALLLYHAGSLLIFSFAQYFPHRLLPSGKPSGSAVSFQGFWVVNAILNLIFQLLAAFAFAKAGFRSNK